MYANVMCYCISWGTKINPSFSVAFLNEGLSRMNLTAYSLIWKQDSCHCIELICTSSGADLSQIEIEKHQIYPNFHFGREAIIWSYTNWSNLEASISCEGAISSRGYLPVMALSAACPSQEILCQSSGTRCWKNLDAQRGQPRCAVQSDPFQLIEWNLFPS